MTTATFADHFSGHAADYARSRPAYPAELFSWLADSSPSTDVAWDCATGNGQAAVRLAENFDRVIATEGSADQLASATPHPRVEYVQALAEQVPIEDGSVDLCACAQAAHWFDLDGYYAEVRRVAKPGALFAAWCYSLFQVDTQVNAVIDRLYGRILGEYWPERRRHIETQYRHLPMPFETIAAPAFEMRHEWTFEQVCEYLRTWSAVIRYRSATGEDPIERVARDLETAWGTEARVVVWPIAMRAGRV
ncbi:MAG: class I SAM-dependent methyltransferase [Planctomycetes bacterium]|nr:class I SAM-dependent methyltransferase [Planctomycetota bacterium]